jgi:hypothetical protein
VRLVYNTHLLYYTVDLEDTLASCHVFASELTQQVDEIREFPRIGTGPHGSSETCFSGEVSLVVPALRGGSWGSSLDSVNLIGVDLVFYRYATE